MSYLQKIWFVNILTGEKTRPMYTWKSGYDLKDFVRENRPTGDYDGLWLWQLDSCIVCKIPA